VHLYARLGVVPMTEDLLFSAVDLHRLEPISFWDALIVRSAQASRCDVLYSEDLQPGRRYGTMRIVNPFAAA
jgi:predicted nucleic acid-binding protein